MNTYTIIKGFTAASMKYARAQFAKGLTAAQTIVLMKKRYRNMPTSQAVAWAYINYHKGRVNNRSNSRRNSSTTSARKSTNTRRSTSSRTTTRRKSTRKASK